MDLLPLFVQWYIIFAWPKFRSALPLCGYHTWPAPPQHLAPSMFHTPYLTLPSVRQSTFKTHTGCRELALSLMGVSGADTAAVIILVIWRVCDPWFSSQSSAAEWWETLSGIVRVISCFVHRRVMWCCIQFLASVIYGEKNDNAGIWKTCEGSPVDAQDQVLQSARGI